MQNKIKLCLKWAGESDVKKEWLRAFSKSMGNAFEVYAEEGDRQGLLDAGIEPQTLGADWGEGSQALLLAMAASGEAEAAIWIDESEGCSNLTPYVTRLCRQKQVALAIEPVGAAAMLSGMATAREREHAEQGCEDGESDEEPLGAEAEIVNEPPEAIPKKRAARKMKAGFAHKRRVEVKKRSRGKKISTGGGSHGSH